MSIYAKAVTGIVFIALSFFFVFSSLATERLYSRLQKSILNEDWEAVIKLVPEGALEGTSENLPRPKVSAVYRAIKGHACLRLNRNNESLALFISIANEMDRKEWKDWTSAFANQYPENHVVYYLKGDALARIDDWHGAISAYSQALTKKKDFALALNALGCAMASLKEYDKAREYFEASIISSPNFADAHASLGALKVLKEAPDTAISDFDRAIKESSAFALAYNGRACARIGYSRDPESIKTALEDFIIASEFRATKTLAEENLKAISTALNFGSQDTISTSEGMTLTASQFRDMDNATRRGLMEKMSPNQLQSIARKSHENFAHSKSWGEASQYLHADDLKIPFINSTQSLRHANEHLNVFNDANKVLQDKHGINMIGRQGGARTNEIGKGYGDRGNWPVFTWFGLVQRLAFSSNMFKESIKQ